MEFITANEAEKMANTEEAVAIKLQKLNEAITMVALKGGKRMPLPLEYDNHETWTLLEEKGYYVSSPIPIGESYRYITWDAPTKP